MLPGLDRRALPCLLGLRLGDLPGRDARGGEGRHHDGGRHAARQAAAPCPPHGSRRSSPRALRVSRRLRAVRRRPSDDPEDIAALAEGGIVALKLFTGGVAHRACTPGPTPVRCSTACAEPGGGPDRGRALRERRDRRLRDGVACRGRVVPTPAAWDEARPWYSELEAVQRVALVAEVTGCRTVIAHVTAPSPSAYVRDARARGADVWIETCPHYLCVTLEDMAADDAAQVEPAEPQQRVGRAALGSSSREGHVHTVGSDHAPLAEDPRTRTSGRSSPAPATASRRCSRSSPPRRPGAGSRSPRSPACSRRRRPGSSASSRARARSRWAPTPISAVLETNGSRTLDAQELEYHEQEKWSPFDGREVTVFPVYTSCAAA